MSARLSVEDGEISDKKRRPQWGTGYENNSNRRRGDGNNNSNNWGDRRRDQQQQGPFRQTTNNNSNKPIMMTQYQRPQDRSHLTMMTPRNDDRRSRSRSHSSTPRSSDFRRSSSSVRSDSSSSEQRRQSSMPHNNNSRRTVPTPRSSDTRRSPWSSSGTNNRRHQQHERLKELGRVGPMVPSLDKAATAPPLKNRWVPPVKKKPQEDNKSPAGVKLIKQPQPAGSSSEMMQVERGVTDRRVVAVKKDLPAKPVYSQSKPERSLADVNLIKPLAGGALQKQDENRANYLMDGTSSKLVAIGHMSSSKQMNCPPPKSEKSPADDVNLIKPAVVVVGASQVDERRSRANDTSRRGLNGVVVEGGSSSPGVVDRKLKGDGQLVTKKIDDVVIRTTVDKSSLTTTTAVNERPGANGLFRKGINGGKIVEGGSSSPGVDRKLKVDGPLVKKQVDDVIRTTVGKSSHTTTTTTTTTTTVVNERPVKKANDKIRGWLSSPKKRPFKKIKDLGNTSKTGDIREAKKRKVEETEKISKKPKLMDGKGTKHVAAMKKKIDEVPNIPTEVRKKASKERRTLTKSSDRPKVAGQDSLNSKRKQKSSEEQKSKKRKTEMATNRSNENQNNKIRKIDKVQTECKQEKTLVVDTSPYVVSDDAPTPLDATESSFDSAKSVTVAPFVSESPHSAIMDKDDSQWSPVPVVRVERRETVGSEALPVLKSYPLAIQKIEASDDDSDSDSDTDDEEVWQFAEKMFGVTPPGLLKLRQQREVVESSDEDSDESSSDDDTDEEEMHFLPIGYRQRPLTKPKKKKTSSHRKSKLETEQELLNAAKESKRKKEEAKPLTAAQIRAILGEDKAVAPSSHWVRRSSRQPSKAALNSPGVKALLAKLRGNDSDMAVLKMKKYINDPDAPQALINAALDAMEENSNCEALYIQNFNEGMRDEQVLQLLKILQLPTCKIWCLNIGETYNVKARTWKRFARGLKKTKVTHMYLSEHTVEHELKEKIRDTIRLNRKKHDMHNNPGNLDVIVQCTHCWWNPMNAKALRPFLRKKGYEHMLLDKEAQGLRGSSSVAPGGSGNKDSSTVASST